MAAGRSDSILGLLSQAYEIFLMWREREGMTPWLLVLADGRIDEPSTEMGKSVIQGIFSGKQKLGFSHVEL